MAVPAPRAGLRAEPRTLPLVRVAVIGDDHFFFEGLSRIIRGEREFELVDYNDEQVVPVDVVLLDSGIAGVIGVCALVRQRGSAVIFVAAPDDDSWALDALAAGARGIVLKTARAHDVVNAIRAVREGLIWARRRVLAARIDQLAGANVVRRTAGEAVLDNRLSIREREVFHQAAMGLGNKQLAVSLDISEATVKVHLTRIFQKLGVHGRSELAAAYHGILPPKN